MITILYSNTPNPIVIERIESLCRHTAARINLLYCARINSALRLEFSSPEGVNSVRIVTPDVRGFSPKRIFNIIKVYKGIDTQSSRIVAFYADMLLAAILFKIFRRRDAKIFYEIQDLHTRNFFFRAFHNLLMCWANAIFITSRGFKIEISRLTRFFVRTPIVYVSNAPSRDHYRLLRQKCESPTCETLSVGFIGNLRDRWQLDAIKILLDSTNIIIHQAGATDFLDELSDMAAQRPDRLLLYGKYSSDEIPDIWKKVGAVWCAYPNSYNYNHHVARRFHEAISLSKVIIVSSHSREMLKLGSKFLGLVVRVAEDFSGLQDLERALRLSNKAEIETPSFEVWEDFEIRYVRTIVNG